MNLTPIDISEDVHILFWVSSGPSGEVDKGSGMAFKVQDILQGGLRGWTRRTVEQRGGAH